MSKPNHNRLVFRWHRRLGITSALFVLILSITGLLLMFGSSLGLDQKTWGGPLVNSVYNLAPETEPVGIKIERALEGSGSQDIWAVMIDGLVYVGAADPVTLDPPLLAATWQDDFVMFTNGAETVLTLADGSLVERIAGDELFYRTEPTPIPANVKDAVLTRYAGRGLPASRILLDIHTGRFFGKLGTWIMALATLLLIILSLTGIFMWTTTDQRRAKRERMKKELERLRGEG